MLYYIVRGCLLVVEFCDYFGVLYSVGVCTCTCNRLCEWLCSIRSCYVLLSLIMQPMGLLLYRIVLCAWLCMVM